MIVYGLQRSSCDSLCPIPSAWGQIPHRSCLLEERWKLSSGRLLFCGTRLFGRSPQTWCARGYWDFVSYKPHFFAELSRAYIWHWRRLAGIKVMMVTGTWWTAKPEIKLFLFIFFLGDHPKTAEAIARKINLILGDTKETLSAKTGRPIEEIYEDEVDAIVIHGDSIDALQGWEWDQSLWNSLLCCVLLNDLQFSARRKLYSREPPPNINWKLVSHPKHHDTNLPWLQSCIS